MDQLNNNQIEEIKKALIELDNYVFSDNDWDEWFEDNFGAVTHEDAMNFVNHSGRVVAKTESGSARRIDDYQYKSGDPRITIYVVDLGDIRVIFDEK